MTFRGYGLGSGVQCVDVRQNLNVTSSAVKVGALTCVTLAVWVMCLRRRAGIRDQVTFTVWRPATPTTIPLPETTEMDDPNNLSSDEKNMLIRNIRKELVSTKGQLSEYCDYIDDLPSK